MAGSKRPTRSEIGRMLVGFRNQKLTPERRKEIATKAAAARWRKARKKARAPKGKKA